MLNELLHWIETEALFACLLQQPMTGHETTGLMLQRPTAIQDQKLLRQLLPTELYEAAMRAGWMGMHALSFALRHRVTELQLVFHGSAPGVDATRQEILRTSWDDPLSWPLFGFSPLGIHVSRRRRGLCRAYDAMNLLACEAETSDIFCPQHEVEDFWKSDRGSQQSIMYRYFALLENFQLYDEDDLQNMVNDFWQRYPIQNEARLAEALRFFGAGSTGDLRIWGVEGLRKKFLQLSLAHHPDRGGEAAVFVLLQEHYQRLKLCLGEGRRSGKVS